MFFSTLIHSIRSRLATKLIIVVVILLSAVSILLTTFFITRQKKLLHIELYKRAHSLAQNLAYNSRSYLFLEDSTIIQSLVSGVKEEPDMEEVLLTDTAGKILAFTDTTYTGTGETFTIPSGVDSTGGEYWFPSGDTQRQRVIIPVEIDELVVDTDFIPYSFSRGNAVLRDKTPLDLRFWFPGFTHNSKEVTSTVSVRDAIGPSTRIMSTSLENRTLRLLIESGNNGFWSHNGRYLVFNCHNTSTLSVFDTETGNVNSLTRHEISGVPCFTPDDKYVITTLLTKNGHERLFRIPRDGGKPEQLTFHDGRHWYPNCTPDGKWIMYADYEKLVLYVYNTETKKSSRVFHDLRDKHIGGSFSPDGAQFCYLRCVDTLSDSWEVFIADFPFDGKLQSNNNSYGTQLTFTSGYKWFTDWSPDGNWITYGQRSKFEVTGRDIWVVPSRGGDPIKLTGSLQTKRKIISYVVIDVSMENMNKAVAEGNRIALLISLFFTGIGMLSAFLLVMSVVRPVKHLERAVGKVAQGDLDQRVSIDRSDEIGSLAESFNRMTKQLKTSRENIEAKNRELGKAYKELETLDKAKDDFLSLVSHELRTPLSSLLVFSEMLLNEVIETKETRAEIHTTMVEECKRLTRLISDVLNLSKMEAGRMQFHLEKLNIRDLIYDTITRLNPIITGKSIHFDCVNVPEDIYLRGDRDKIIQVLENIMSNALKYTPEKGSISVSLTPGKSEGIIAVRDTGKGIIKEDIPRVFDRFIQLEGIEHHAKGTGLGMTISKSIIERLGGRIWIESEKGRGSTVFFTLPVAERSEQELTINQDIDSIPANNKIQSNNSHAEKILIVDDEKALRLALTECLKSAGFTTIEASEGREALRIARKHRPPLIILDVMLPGMSGLEVCRKLKKDPETGGIKIIMLSARGQEKEKGEGLKAGADRYITKPFDYKELIRAIEELLD